MYRRKSRKQHSWPRRIAVVLPIALLMATVVFFAAGRNAALAEGGPELPPAPIVQPEEPSDTSPVLPPDTPPQEAEEKPSSPELPPPEEPAPPPEEAAQPAPTPPDPAAPEEPAETEADPDDGWMLLLVNPWNALPEDFTVELEPLGDGHAVDKRCYDDLMEMMAACEGEDLSPLICSSYRTQAKQEYLFDRKIKRLMKQGYSQDLAKIEAAKVVAVPGTSEHQLGLALDIVDVKHQTLDRTQEQTDVQQWLMAHSWEYGFILRYPNEKSEITGIIYEPWHYRYVGREAAAEIYEQGVCLEEYLGRVESGRERIAG